MDSRDPDTFVLTGSSNEAFRGVPLFRNDGCRNEENVNLNIQSEEKVLMATTSPRTT
jgi:hypothetical protein